jgi:PPM family protein phosphatase
MTAEGGAGTRLALVEVAHLSDTGRVRHHNEDRSVASSRILAVADGMGGAKAGEVAAQVAVDSVNALAAVDPESVRRAIERANRAIRRMASEDPDKSGMGTTMTAAVVRDGQLDVVHVGDSRAYLWREGRLSQVTEDHSVVGELVRRGTITAEEAESHPHRNVITRALGADAEVQTDTVSTGLREDDVVLLCSDGLSSYVSEADIAAALAAAPTLADAARALVNRANAAGGMDNVTVVLARVGAVSGDASGDTLEVPVLAPEAPGDATATATATGEVRVLGGVHGHAGSERAGVSAARPPKVLEPAGRRRSRALPVLAGIVALLIIIGGAIAWIASRTYTVEAGPRGTVQVAHGLPLSILGRELSVEWQDTGVSADLVRAAQPAALSSSARGQGEAVGLAASLVWRYGVSQPPVIEAPAPPAPATTSTTPRTTTAP